MNANDDISGLRDDDRRFDRLVDGELSEAERREMLLRLDDQPGAWRRCALAFLEAQALRHELGASVPAAAESENGDSPHLCAAPSGPFRQMGTVPFFRPNWRSSLAGALAVAASFQVAFVLGMHVRSGPAGPGNRGLPDDSLASAAVGEADAGHTSRQATVPAPPGPPAVSPGQWQLVTLQGPAGPEGETATIQLPAVERETYDEHLFENLPSAVPERLLQALRQRGLEVRQERQILNMELRDGRQLVVPTDRVQVRYVGGPTL